MSIKYKVIPKKIPGKPNQSFYFALAIPQETIGLNRLAELISDGSTLRRADVYASLIGMVDIMKRELREGNAVHLGDLGKFSVGIRSEACIDAREVNSRKIVDQRLKYAPSKYLKLFLKTLEYSKMKKD